MRRLFRQFSFPGGIPSHVAPETPGSIHEGGELGYALAHAYGAAFDNPDLLVVLRRRRRRGRDRPAGRELALEQVPRPGARRRGAADPAPQRLQDRQPDGARADPATTSCARCSTGYGYAPRFVEGDEPDGDAPADGGRRSTRSLDEIAAIQRRAPASGGAAARPRWPMIVLRTPKGWTGPKEVDGLPAEGTFRSHQVPLARPRRATPSTSRQLEEWLRSYRPEELFDERRRACAPELARAGAARASGAWAPTRTPTAACCCATCELPDFRDYAVDVPDARRTRRARRRACSARSCAT